jgi:DNA-binding SARP family transcriptional activator
VVLAQLSLWAQEHPLDERLTGQLMLALFRSGRQADALDAYRRVRERLADELGTGPGRALHELHERILTDDPSLGVGPVSIRSVVRVSCRPRHGGSPAAARNWTRCWATRPPQAPVWC